MRTSVTTTLAILVTLSLFACNRDDGGTAAPASACEFNLDASTPEGDNLDFQEGTEVDFLAKPDFCGDPEVFVAYSWTLDGVVVSDQPGFVLLACEELVGAHVVEVTGTDIDGRVAVRTWDVNVAAGLPAPPDCYDSAVDIISGGDKGAYQEALDCLGPYSETNVCNLESNYATGLARGILVGESLYGLFDERNQLPTDTAVVINDEQMQPMIRNFDRVARRAGDDFSFQLFMPEFTLLPDLPETDQSESFQLDLTGEHDRGEALAVVGFGKMATAFYHIGNAYQGLFEFVHEVPFDLSWDMVQIIRTFRHQVERALIDKLESDPQFMMLKEDGRDTLRLSQQALVEGMTSLIDAYKWIITETDDQTDDLFRWGDCGRDGVCPPDESFQYPPLGDLGDPFEDNNLDGRRNDGEAYLDINWNFAYNQSWADTGPDEDGSEGNGIFDEGEPVGASIFNQNLILERDFITIPISDMILNILPKIIENVKGPDPLDYDELVGLPSGTVKAFAEAIGVPVPDIRLSQAFIDPPHMREILPLYDIEAGEAIIQGEWEPFDDYGFDGLIDYDEPGYSLQTNHDPNGDNVDFLCNPTCNLSDGVDNDRDGRIDEYWYTAISPIPGTGFGEIAITGDWGLEGDYYFEWRDTNGNGVCDTGDTSEPWHDIGIFNGMEYLDVNGSIGNGIRDAYDVAHVYPSGPNIGGTPTQVTIDPANSVSADENLVDIYYVFLPDPTFSGMFVYEGNYINANGEQLTGNALLHRTISKLLDFAFDFGLLP